MIVVLEFVIRLAFEFHAFLDIAIADGRETVVRDVVGRALDDTRIHHLIAGVLKKRKAGDCIVDRVLLELAEDFRPLSVRFVDKLMGASRYGEQFFF